MKAADAIKLIENGITGTSTQRWVDLGCGGGTFTLALASILPPGSAVIAIDKERQGLPNFIRADFIKDELSLGAVDGILMANSLHYVKDKAALINKFSPPKFLIVEYDTTRSNPWVPYPINFKNLQELFSSLGYKTDKLAEQPSRFGGTLYAALASK